MAEGTTDTSARRPVATNPRPKVDPKTTIQDLKKSNIDTAMATRILNEVLVEKPGVAWDDIGEEERFAFLGTF